jgi:hypothetical protein
MKINRAALSLTLLWAATCNAQALGPTQQVRVARGWHPWYELKADQEDPQNLMICGTRWDPAKNSFLGFVYASRDGGVSWSNTLEDRHSAWVTEQSCAFGPNHAAYFVSEASQVLDGAPHHENGTTRLFLSKDAGQHWTESVKTAWADYSTSAVGPLGKVYTFYNAWYTTHQSGSNAGGEVGLLVFSPDGKAVEGPFLDQSNKVLTYRGVFPSDAIALKSGSVVALYGAKREAAGGWEADLGIIRADQSTVPLLSSTVIAHPSITDDCFTVSDTSLTYDQARDRLFLAYVDGCKGPSKIVLTSSGDEGRTWESSAVILASKSVTRKFFEPTISLSPSGELGLLWQEGNDRRTGSWAFSYIRRSSLSGQQLELLSSPGQSEVLDDSLLTSVNRDEELKFNPPFDSSSATITMLSELNNVWRGHGLISSGGKLIVAWPSVDKDGQWLNVGAIAGPAVATTSEASKSKVDQVRDVGQNTVLLFGGSQHFDVNNGNLSVCLTVANRGPTPINTPIRIQAQEIHSSAGTISILNATNNVDGEGAVWDVSNSVTGNQIPPGTMSNPFCLSFHLQLFANETQSFGRDKLLVLKLYVLGSMRNK